MKSSETVTLDEVWRLFKETDRQIKETEQSIKETNATLNKTIKSANRRINKLEELFVGQWGKLIESLVDGAVVRLFNERGIEVRHTSTD